MSNLSVSVFRLNVVSKGLWLLISVSVVSVISMSMGVVSMWVFFRSNVVHLQAVSTLRATLQRAIARHLRFLVRN